MSDGLPNYDAWSATCDTLHAHTQVLGKLAAVLAAPEPNFQHGALRLTARGWETLPLPAPDGSGGFVAGLDLRLHEAFAEHSDGRRRRVALTPDRTVGEVTRELLTAVRELTGPVEIDPEPAEVWWTVPLDVDTEHASYDVAAAEAYFSAATHAALVLAAWRAPYRGSSTPVNAWWGSFDLAVSLSDGAQEVAVGWWPGDPKYPKAALYAYIKPAPDGSSGHALSPAQARWDERLGEYILDWDDVCSSADPQAAALEFARSAFSHACDVFGWDSASLLLADS
jgi:hypothetical protein